MYYNFVRIHPIALAGRAAATIGTLQPLQECSDAGLSFQIVGGRSS